MDRSCKRARAVVRVFCCFPPSCRTQVGYNSLAKLRSPLQLLTFTSFATLYLSLI